MTAGEVITDFMLTNDYNWTDKWSKILDVQCILAYPNLAYPNSQTQDYNIIHKHFNDIHIAVELSIFFYAFHISEFFSYPNKHILCLHKGVRIREDALYMQWLYAKAMMQTRFYVIKCSERFQGASIMLLQYLPFL